MSSPSVGFRLLCQWLKLRQLGFRQRVWRNGPLLSGEPLFISRRAEGAEEQHLRHAGTGTATTSYLLAAGAPPCRVAWYCRDRRYGGIRRHARMGARPGLSKQSLAQCAARGIARGRRKRAASAVGL